jgi:hypothetical protein
MSCSACSERLLRGFVSSFLPRSGPFLYKTHKPRSTSASARHLGTISSSIPRRRIEETLAQSRKDVLISNRAQRRKFSSKTSTDSEPAKTHKGKALRKPLFRKIPGDAKREPWQIQKEALKKKFGNEGWNPRKRLAPDVLDEIRALHANDPTAHSTTALAEQFRVSPEAIRRILKSKWRPTEEEQEDRRKRWLKRGDEIWDHMVELGLRDPTKKRPREESESKSKSPGEETETGTGPDGLLNGPVAEEEQQHRDPMPSPGKYSENFEQEWGNPSIRVSEATTSSPSDVLAQLIDQKRP